MAGVFTTAWQHKNPCMVAREYNLTEEEYEKAPRTISRHERRVDHDLLKTTTLAEAPRIKNLMLLCA
jgi:hypothetical protein